MFAALATHPWAYPALEVAHIFGIALLVGNLALFELRIWGAGQEIMLKSLARLALRLAVGGFCIAAATGLLMFASRADELITNRAFQLKMALLVVSGSNAAWFHLRGGLTKADAFAKAQTLISLGLWLVVMICGRWIAYR